jgi:hypothetical protein
MTEKELVTEIINLKYKIEYNEADTKLLKEKLDKLTELLLEYAESKEIKTTAKYDGIGSITIPDPQVFANISKENKEEAFKFLKDNNLDGFIEETIHTKVLSREIKTLIEEGIEIPQCINVFKKKVIRINK